MKLSTRDVLLVGLTFLLLTGLQLWPQASEILRFSRSSYAHGATWQLLTSQLVHLNWAHTWVNASAFALTLFLWRSWLDLCDQLCSLAGGLLGVALVLALDANCAYYAGLSGALHGLWAGNALTLLGRSFINTNQSKLAQGPPDDMWQGCMALSVLLLLMCKLWLQSNAAPGTSDAWLGIPIYRPAHEAGLAGGLALTGLILFIQRPTRRCRQ